MTNPDKKENKRKTSLNKLRDELIQAMRTSNSETRKDVYQSIIDRIEAEYLEMEKKDITDAYYFGGCEFSEHSTKLVRDSKLYYNETFIS